MCRRKSAILTSVALALGLGLSAAQAQETRQTELTDSAESDRAESAELNVASLEDLIEEFLFYSDVDEPRDQMRSVRCDPTECPHLYDPHGKSSLTDGSPTRATALDQRDVCRMVWSDPPNCAVDARQPHHLYDDGIRFGWQSIELPYSCCNIRSTDLAVTVEYGRPPEVVDVLVDGETVTLLLSEPIPPGQWTCISYGLAQPICLGYLPGDVNGDLTSAPSDIIAFINSLNGAAVPRPDYSGDVDRDGCQAPADILRIVDLLNGAAAFQPWLDVRLPPCPSARPTETD